MNKIQEQIKYLDDHYDAWVMPEYRNIARTMEKLIDALTPFAQYNDALKEWRFGPSNYLLQEKRPEHIPYMRWIEPEPPPGIKGTIPDTIRILEIWPSDFQRAEDILK